MGHRQAIQLSIEPIFQIMDKQFTSTGELFKEKESSVVFDLIRNEMLEEYLQSHSNPWVVGYSGGKDSTLVVHLLFELLLSLPPSQRTRQVHIVGNDTLVESPLVMFHLAESIKEIGDAATAFGFPVKTKITSPAKDQSFWVNLIGRGYPSPNRSFRWCTDRLKIQPTSRYIKCQVDEAGEVILLLGVRRSESAMRSGIVSRYDNGLRLHRHPDLVGCMVFRPILELSKEDVWEFLAESLPPWGGSYDKLITLYRDAGGGECPVVSQKSDAPSCGSTSSRFGCWTCTVVAKDRSLEGFVDSGFNEFKPLLDFRDWLVTIRTDPKRRQARRRNGRITVNGEGSLIPGPFTLKARSEILEELRKVELAVKQVLISKIEVDMIHKIWASEIAKNAEAKPMKVYKVNNGAI